MPSTATFRLTSRWNYASLSGSCRIWTRLSLDGNPDIGKDWTTTSLEYLDDDGQTRLMEIPFTLADFAVHEGRFKKHFLTANGNGDLVPVHEYIDLSVEERHGKAPFIWSTDADLKLIRLAVSTAIVELTEECRRNWRMLAYLGGLHVERMQESHRRELEDWQRKYERSNAEREGSINSIARGMAELAFASSAPALPSIHSVPIPDVTRVSREASVARSSRVTPANRKPWPRWWAS